MQIDGRYYRVFLFVIFLLKFVISHSNEISIFDLSTEIRVFSIEDENIHSPEFRQMAIDQRHPNYLYLASLNFVYRLDSIDISQDFVRSANLSEAAGNVLIENTVNCLAKGRPKSACMNYVRAVIPFSDGRLFVCSTGAESPIVYYLNLTTLEMLSIEYKGGRARCPYDPHSNFTIVYVDKGNPGNVATSYSGTSFTNSDSVIFRPTLHSGENIEYRLLRTEPDTRWLNEPEFVASFEIGEYVYFFLRELAVENLNCEKVIFSRVARICKNDEGGGSLSMDFRWTTFLKARLICASSSVASQQPAFIFNEIQDVVFNRSESIFYALFNTVQGGFWGCAICAFSLASIDGVLDTGQFKNHPTFESAWFPLSDKDVPQPRPGQCRGNSLDLSASTLSFIKMHPLIHQVVEPLGGKPLWFTKEDLSLNKIIVHQFNKYSIFYLASSRGLVYKIVHQWETDEMTTSKFATSSILRPLQSNNKPILQMILHKHHHKKTVFLYILTSEMLLQVDVEACHLHVKCSTCARDPYCAWNADVSSCKPFKNGWIQNVWGSADEICSKSCQPTLKQYSTTRQLLQGSSIFLNCSHPCLTTYILSQSSFETAPTSISSPTLKVIWHFSDFSSARLVINDNKEFITTQDGGLVILNVRSKHNGTFSCSVNNIVVSRHTIQVLPCKLDGDQEVTWRQEFTKWCSAYTNYMHEYKHWACLKKESIETNCISRNILKKCEHLQSGSVASRTFKLT